MAPLKLAIVAILVMGIFTFPQQGFTQQLPTNTAPPGEKTTAQPRLVIEFPALDMGTVEPGSLITNEFTFTNQGDAPLEIVEVRPGCSCATAKFDSMVAPGQAGKITIPVNIYKEWVGQKFRKVAWVLTNDPLTPQLRLVIYGEVAPLPSASPSKVKQSSVFQP